MPLIALLMNVSTRKNAHCIEMDIALKSPHNKLSGYEPIFLFFDIYEEKKIQIRRC